MNRFFASKCDILLHVVIVALSFSMLSCSEEGTGYTPLVENNYITWNVVSTDMQSGRALIINDDMLKSACSTGGKSIGIWSAYEYEGVTTYNVLGNDNGDVSLIYDKDTNWDNYRWWTYGETAAEWVIGAKYTFNAYYPKYVVNEISSSDESTFVVDYNTERHQEDLMTAYAYVDTQDTAFNQNFPVQLKMLHTLSAMRFQFSFINADNTTYEDNDALTAFWFENTLPGRGIATTGVLAFGTVDENGVMDGEHIHWYNEDYPEPSTPTKERRIFEWQDNSGVNFNSTTTERNVATAYSTDFDGNQKYAVNDGWILIIPQTTDGTVKLCFKLKTTGDDVHRIALPAAKYDAGMRYTYDIRFGQTSVNLVLKIADWNELKSTQNIPL